MWDGANVGEGQDGGKLGWEKRYQHRGGVNSMRKY